MRSYSMRSWPGVLLNAAIALPALGRWLTQDSFLWPLDAAAAIVCSALAVCCFVARLDVGTDGIARRPGFLFIPWSDVNRFEPKPRREHVRQITVVRQTSRGSNLCPYWTSPDRGRALFDALEARLAESRR